MLQAIDERLSLWGWQTGTGTKFAIIVDTRGKGGDNGAAAGESGAGRAKGIGDGDVKIVSQLRG